jgi:hypothetical protein
MNLFFPGMELQDLARAMINAGRFGAPKQVLEVADVHALARADEQHPCGLSAGRRAPGPSAMSIWTHCFDIAAER